MGVPFITCYFVGGDSILVILVGVCGRRSRLVVKKLHASETMGNYIVGISRMWHRVEKIYLSLEHLLGAKPIGLKTIRGFPAWCCLISKAGEDSFMITSGISARQIQVGSIACEKKISLAKARAWVSRLGSCPPSPAVILADLPATSPLSTYSLGEGEEKESEKILFHRETSRIA